MGTNRTVQWHAVDKHDDDFEKEVELVDGEPCSALRCRWRRPRRRHRLCSRLARLDFFDLQRWNLLEPEDKHRLRSRFARLDVFDLQRWNLLVPEDKVSEEQWVPAAAAVDSATMSSITNGWRRVVTAVVKRQKRSAVRALLSPTLAVAGDTALSCPFTKTFPEGAG
jgi:hypothetical protein